MDIRRNAGIIANNMDRENIGEIIDSIAETSDCSIDITDLNGWSLLSATLFQDRRTTLENAVFISQALINNGCSCVCEAANMPCTAEAVELFQKNKVMFAPGKAANAGGVSTSGLEMSQNAMKLSWTCEEVDMRLHQIMRNIHASCVKYGKNDNNIDYVKGANIAGFLKVANAMLDQGVV